MKLIIIEKNNPRLNRFLDWLISMVGYTCILLLLSYIFPKSLIVDNFGWAILASVVIWFLNQTIKPILVYLTLPLTGLTMGLFYPIINVIILYLTSFIFRIFGPNHFDVNNFWIVFIIAILISILNIVINSIAKKLMKKVK